MKQSLTATNSYKHILSVALPMSLAIMIPQVSILANSIFLGNYVSTDGLVHGKEALSVAGVAGIYYLVYAMICFGLASGMLMLMSRKAGNDDAVEVGNVFSGGVQLGLLIAVILLIICWFFTPWFFEQTVHNNVIQNLSREFMKIRIWGVPFLFLAHLGNMLYIAVDKTKFMLYGTLFQTITNIVLDYFLIFGNGIFPEMGVAGAAWASVVAEVVFFVIVFLIIRYHQQFRRFNIVIFKRIKQTVLIDYCLKSSPLMLQYFISIGAWEVFFLFVEHLGERELGASQIIRSVYGIMGILIWALSNTTNSLVSNLYGQKAFDNIIPLIKKVTKISVSYTLVIASLLFFFNEYFLGLYTTDLQIIDLARPALFVVLLASLVFSFSTIYFNAMLGLGDTRRNLIYEAITIAGYLVYCYWVIEKQKPPLWVAWCSEYVYWILMLLFSGIYIHSKKWMPKL